MTPTDPKRRPPPTPEEAELEAKSWADAFRRAADDPDESPDEARPDDAGGRKHPPSDD